VAVSALPNLMRRIDRKLDIQRGLSLSYDDLALLVATGAYARLQEASKEYRERQCREHVARTHSISGASTGSTPDPDETSKSSGMTPSESANDALARAQRTLTPAASPSTGTISARPGANMPRRSAGRARS
jgi:hypothetical protein